MTEKQQIGEYFKTLVESFEFDEISITDKNGIIVDVHGQCQDLFGIPKEEMLGKSVYDLEKKKILSKSITIKVIETKKQASFIQQTAGGRRLLVTGIPQFNRQGSLQSVITASRDLTNYEEMCKKISEIENQFDWINNEYKKMLVFDSNHVIGDNPKMRKVILLIKQIADTNANIIMLGETGVGKSFYAKFVHKISRRRNNPFVQINFSAIPQTMLKTELFGIGGNSDKKGLFEAAGYGTILLDEIEDIPLRLQAQLLDILQKGEFYRSGDVVPQKLNARIISATNKNIAELVKNGKFREDLYYRLNVVPIHIPPLRTRVEDIPKLVHHFLKIFNQKYSVRKYLDADAYQLLASLPWKGNVREMENLLERLVITCKPEKIGAAVIKKAIINNPTDNSENEIRPLKAAVQETEERLISLAIQKYHTTRRAAEALQVDQSTIVKKMKRFKAEHLSL